MKSWKNMTPDEIEEFVRDAIESSERIDEIVSKIKDMGYEPYFEIEEIPKPKNVSMEDMTELARQGDLSIMKNGSTVTLTLYTYDGLPVFIS